MADITLLEWLKRQHDKATAALWVTIGDTQRVCLEDMNYLRLAIDAVDTQRWRPISEDYGQCVLIDIRDPGKMAVGNNCDLDFEEQGWTHFVQVPKLSIAEAEKLEIELRERTEAGQ